jgi:hypothetical protein
MKNASPNFHDHLSAATFISAINVDSPRPPLHSCTGQPMGCLATAQLTGAVLSSRHHRCHYLEGRYDDLANVVDEISRCHCLLDPMVLSIRPISNREFSELFSVRFDQNNKQSIRSLSWLMLKLDHGLDLDVSSPMSVLRRFWHCEI